jgi:hypothetical protein
MYTIVITSVELAAVDNVRTLLANFIVLVSVLLPVVSCVMAKVMFCPVTILVMAFKVMLPVAVMVCIEPNEILGVMFPVALPKAYGGCVNAVLEITAAFDIEYPAASMLPVRLEPIAPAVPCAPVVPCVPVPVVP